MKRFIALALTLAMMVSCFVFTASAADTGVAVILEGPAVAAQNETFVVRVRITDTNLEVGGVQGIIEATGATVSKVDVNPQLLAWNDTDDANTIYKVENNKVSFASLNNLDPESYATRLWLSVTYKVDADAESVSVAMNGVKVSDKTANLIYDYAKPTTLNIGVVGEGDANATIGNMSIYVNNNNKNVDYAEPENQGLVVQAGVNVPDDVADSVSEIGVLFYPFSLLGGEELTVDTEGAIFARVTKADNAASVSSIIAGGAFNGALNFNFENEENLMKFLGTQVAARVYYVVGEGEDKEVVYSANNVDGKSFIRNGVAARAVLNAVIDAKDTLNDDNWGDKAEFNAKLGSLKTSDADWQANRRYVLKFAVYNASFVPAA